MAYPVSTLWNYDDVRQLALQRFVRTQVLDRPRAEPEQFDLDAYIPPGHFHIRQTEESLTLGLRFDAEAAYRLYEAHLASDQRREPVPDGRVEPTATVQDTAQLRWWLRRFGSAVEVLSPAYLREDFRTESARLAVPYAGLPP